MKKIFKFMLLLFVCLLAGRNLYAQTGRYNIIPYPAILEPQKGEFIINKQTAFIVSPGAAIFNNEKPFLKRMITSYLGTGALGVKSNLGKNVIVLKYDASIKTEEGYKLTINPEKITLSAKNPAGMFYAMETLRQLLPADVEKGKGASLAVPAVNIDDQPAFEWRGMMLDVSRHFFSVEYLQKYVDMMALYKMNKLHLHLTDDQGWRIEIKKYPDLTSKSGWRTFNNQDTLCMKAAAETGNTDMKIDEKHIVQKDGKTLYGGFYTQQQMKEFIEYAASRHVEVIPEIDMPGHMMAAVKLYNYLTCDGTLGDGRGFSNPICPCNPQVLDFAKDIFSEIADLFPSKYIHIGGDEVDKRNWDKSPVCQAFMKQKGFTSLDQIQSFFTDYMKMFFQSKGKTLIGWDEIIDGGIDSSAVVMFWRPWAKDAPFNATKNHNKVIMSPDGPLYFDAVADKNALKGVYDYNPLDKQYRLSKDQEPYISGVQANLWSEMVPTEARADYMIMPRMTALSELGWTHQYLYNSYLERLIQQYKRLDNLKVNYRMPDIEGLVEDNVFVGETAFFKTAPIKYFTIRFTTDGSMPLSTSPALLKPIIINRSLQLKLALFTPDGRRGDVSTLYFESGQYAAAKQISDLQNGISCSLYKGRVDSTVQIKPIADSTFIATRIKIPGNITAADYALKFNGFIDVPKTGVYTFFLNCNDGGGLHIGGKLLIDNDGLHPDKEKGAQVALQKGLQPIALEFVAAGGGDLLDLTYITGNTTPATIPASWFKTIK
jgi:hexosaminidase